MTLLLVVALIGFAISGFFLRREARSNPLTTDRTRLLHYSLAAANLNVAGTVFALVGTISSHGALALTGPLFIVAGLFLFQRLHRRFRTQSGAVFEIHTFAKVMTRGERDHGEHFAAYFSVAMALVGVLVLGWELHVGARAIAFLISPGTEHSFWSLLAISVGVVLAISVYVRNGGYTMVVLTDVAQCLAIGGFLIAVAASILRGSTWETTAQINIFHVPEALGTWDIVSFVLLIGCLNLFGQIQSPINWQIAKSIERDGTFLRVAIKAAVILIGVWIALYAVATTGSTEVSTAYEPWMRLIAAPEPVYRALFLVGIVGFLLSSADSLVLGSYNLISDSARSRGGAVSRQIASKVSFRRFVPSGLLFAATVGAILMATRPNLLFSLMAITGSLVTFAPVFVYILIGRADLVASHERAAHCLFGLFIVTSGTLFVLSSAGLGSLMVFVVFASLALSFGCRSHTDSLRGAVTRKRHDVVEDAHVSTIGLREQPPSLVESRTLQ